MFKTFVEIEDYIARKGVLFADWYYISGYKYLPEDFLEKYKYFVCWNTITVSHELTESFIEKYKNKLDLYWISEHKIFSDEFKVKYNLFTKDEFEQVFLTEREYLDFILNELD